MLHGRTAETRDRVVATRGWGFVIILKQDLGVYITFLRHWAERSETLKDQLSADTCGSPVSSAWGLTQPSHGNLGAGEAGERSDSQGGSSPPPQVLMSPGPCGLRLLPEEQESPASPCTKGRGDGRATPLSSG